MNLEGGQLIEIAVGLLIAAILMVAAASMPRRFSIALLLLAVPFQAVETRYGSASVAAAYALAFAFLIQDRPLKIPLPGAIAAVLVAYMISISQLDRSAFLQNGLYLVSFASGLVMFVLAYNLARDVREPAHVINLLIAINVLVGVYCLIQLAAGPGNRPALFGLDALRLHSNRGADDPRLVGPFGGSPGLTAEYFVLMTLILVYQAVVVAGPARRWLLALIAVNLGFIAATANRGGIMVLAVTFPLLLYIYRREIGTARAIRILAGGLALAFLLAVMVVAFTDFDRVFMRFQDEIIAEGGIPKTRSGVWPATVARLQENMWTGHGPGIEFTDEPVIETPRRVNMAYPHNLYLFLLFTVGIVGFLSMMFFFARLGLRMRSARNRVYESDYLASLVRLGPLLLLAFLIDQGKIEFLRFAYTDYQHFAFSLFGIFLGFADRWPIPDAAATESHVDDAVHQRPMAAPIVTRRSRSTGVRAGDVPLGRG